MKNIVLIVFLVLTLLVPTVALADSVPVTATVYDNSMNLENKDSSWTVISGDSIGGVIGYNTAGTTFDFGLDTIGLADGNYSLIYYADTEDRYNAWGGIVATGIGTVIATGNSSSGIMSITGSVELGMDLPMLPDANAYFYDYTQAPDSYDTATGAKLWVVPTSVLTGGVMPIASWSPDNNWLFETDLINYDDTDIASPDIVAISISPTTIDFGILAPCKSSDRVVTVTNTGYVDTDVTVGIPATSVFKYITTDWSGNMETVLDGSYEDVTLTLAIPCYYKTRGTESGVVTFTATATPTP